jgi:hypothetical protein
MSDDDAIERKRERLAAETYEYFWNVCPELTAQWKQAMFTLPPSVLQDLAVEIKHLEAVTNVANHSLMPRLTQELLGVVSRSKVSSIAPSPLWKISGKLPTR